MRGIIYTIACCLCLIGFGQVAIESLPDQIIGKEGTFDTVHLAEFTSSEVFWSASFLKTGDEEIAPNWSVNSAGFQFEMSLTATVTSKGIKAVGDSHQLAVVDSEGEVRSVGTAVAVADEWIYFMTVYSNTNQEELFYRFYDDSLSQTLKGAPSFNFTSNAVLGQPDAPVGLSFGNLKLSLVGGALKMDIQDTSFIGTERVLVTARSLADPNDSATDTVSFKVVDDYVPVLVGIPDQIVSFNEEFTSFDLDDYTQLQDSDEITFSFSNNNELELAIDVDNVVTIVKPADWSGEETVKFTVTDVSENSFTSSQNVKFRGKSRDQAPVITSIEDQTTGIRGNFEQINLADFVASSNPESILWDFEFITDSSTAVPDWSFSPNEFQFDMTATIAVNALGKKLVGTEHTVAAFSGKTDQVLGTTNAVLVNDEWLYFLTINNNEDQDSVYFKVYDANSSRILPTKQYVTFSANEVLGDPLEPIQIEAGYIFPNIDQDVLSFTLLDADWVGNEALRLTATDTQTDQMLSDSDTIILRVLDTRPPVLQEVPTQSVLEGTVLNSLDLSSYLSNVTTEQVIWSISGADTLKPVLNGSTLSFSLASEHYFGVETIIVRATSTVNDVLFDEISIQLETENVNDEPSFKTEPLAIANLNELYQYDIVVEDLDKDELSLQAQNLPSWLYFVSAPNGGLILGIPTISNAGDFAFDIVLSDGHITITKEVSITVASGQIEAVPNQEIQEGDTFDQLVLNNYLTLFGTINTVWSVSEGSELTTSIADSDKLTVEVPNSNWFGKEDIEITLSNAENGFVLDTKQIQYEVINVNDAPIITSTPSGSGTIGQTYSYAVLTEDIDGDVLTVTTTNLPSWLTLVSNQNGVTILGTPSSADSGANEFQVVVSDGIETVTQEVSILIGSVGISTIADQTIAEGNKFDTLALDTYIVSVGTFNLGWTVTEGAALNVSINTENKLIVTTPDEDWFGKESITVSLIDSDNGDVYASQSIVYEVTNVNDAPIITSTPSGSGTIGQTYSYAVLTEDIDGDVLTVTTTNLPSWLTLVSNQNGVTILGTPSSADSGANEFQVVVSDGIETVTQEVSILIGSVGISTIADQTIAEGSKFDTLALDTYIVSVGTFNLGWTVTEGAALNVSINTENKLIVTAPNEDWFGKETITVSLIDSDNDDVFASQSIVYEVTNVNDAPEFMSDPSAEVQAGEEWEVKTLVTDVDGDNLSYALIDAPSWLKIFSENDGFTLFGIPPFLDMTYDFEVLAADGTISQSKVISLKVNYTPLSAKHQVSGISIYPNPSQDFLWIDSKAKIERVEIINEEGKILFLSNTGTKRVELSSLASGIYFLKVNQSRPIKFIKQ
ncbi:MAG: T9SS type A sorting domain-containing protein [Cyclobacteriaceae bacterium]